MSFLLPTEPRSSGRFPEDKPPRPCMGEIADRIALARVNCAPTVLGPARPGAKPPFAVGALAARWGEAMAGGRPLEPVERAMLQVAARFGRLPNDALQVQVPDVATVLELRRLAGPEQQPQTELAATRTVESAGGR